MNIDNLSVFLELFIKRRELKSIDRLFEELRKRKITFKDIRVARTLSKSCFRKFEKERFKNSQTKYNQEGAVQAYLDLTNDRYWRYRKKYLKIYQDYPYNVRVTEKWRNKLKKRG